jgi:hypothetical protein
VRFFVLSANNIQFISAEQAGTGITKDMHLEPGFMGVVHIQPPVGFAGIKAKLPFAAFAASLARFYSFCHAHRIDLSSAMSLGC